MAIRDNEAQEIVGEVERREGIGYSVDKYLLDKAKEIGIVSAEFVPRLENIFIMRSLFAHPYAVEPAEEEVRAAMVIAVESVLSQPSFLRQGYIRHLSELLFTNPHYLDDVEDKVSLFAHEVSGRILPSLHRDLFISLCKRLEDTFDDADLTPIRRRAIWFAKAYLGAVSAQLEQQSWAFPELIVSYPQSACAILASASLWPHLPEQAQDMLIGISLDKDKRGEVPPETLNLFQSLHDDGLLTDRQSTRIAEAIDDVPISVLALTTIPLDRYGDRIIRGLSSHTWPLQNPAVEVLENIGSEKVSEARAELQEQLGRNLLQAADGGARRAISLLTRLATDARPWPHSFLKGIAFECFVNDDNELRYKTPFMEEALQSVLPRQDDTQPSILTELLAAIKTSEPKSDWQVVRESRKAQNALEGLLGTLPDENVAIKVDIQAISDEIAHQQNILLEKRPRLRAMIEDSE